MGSDFKFKIKANGRTFHFWLNSESIRNRDLTELYESKDFNIHETSTDEELMHIILPKNISLESNKTQRNRSSTVKNSIRQSFKGNRELIESRINDIKNFN